MPTESPSTGELQNILVNTHSRQELTDYINQYTTPAPALSFPAVFRQLLNQHNLSFPAVIKAANQDRNYAYQLLNGSRNPGRDKVLALGIAAGFSVKEIRRLLECAQAGILYSRSSRDAVILYGIENHLSLDQINDILSEQNEKIIE